MVQIDAALVRPIPAIDMETDYLTMAILPEEVLFSLAAGIVGPHTVAVVLGGSHARGDATPWSDVDLLHLVEDLPSGSEKTYQFTAGHLVSIATRTLAWYRSALTKPEQAIFMVPALRDARRLLDKDGRFHAFQQELYAFQWSPLQPAANQFASQFVTQSAEAVLKLFSSQVRKDWPTIFSVSMALFFDLTLAAAVQKGCFIDGSLSYLTQVEKAVGEDTAWTRIHRQYIQVELDSASEPPVQNHRLLAVRLYIETVQLLKSIMGESQRAVCERTIQVLDSTGF